MEKQLPGSKGEEGRKEREGRKAGKSQKRGKLHCLVGTKQDPGVSHSRMQAIEEIELRTGFKK